MPGYTIVWGPETKEGVFVLFHLLNDLEQEIDCAWLSKNSTEYWVESYFKSNGTLPVDEKPNHDKSHVEKIKQN